MRARDLARWMWTLAPLLAAARRSGRPHPTPFTISFLITNRCTLHCAHCFYHLELAKPSHDELTLDELERLSDSMGPFGVGLFCGGEPYMRRDLALVINKFRATNEVPMAGAASNGQGTASILRQTEQILGQDRHKPFNLSLSIEGFREVHDSIRGAQTFDRAVRTWRELKRLGAHYPNLVLTITTVVSTMNQDSSDRWVRWAAAHLEPEAINVLLVRQAPRAGEQLKEVLLERYRAAQAAAMECMGGASLLGRLKPQSMVLGAMADHVLRTRETGQRSFHCQAGRHGAVIDYRGEVNVCEVLSEDRSTRSIGNLRDYGMSFPALWNSAAADRMRAQVNCHSFCKACTHETVGLLPSLAFGPNALGQLVTGGWRGTARIRAAS